MPRRSRTAIVKRDELESRNSAGHRYDYAGTGTAHWDFAPPVPGTEFNARYTGVLHQYNPEG